jgi:hypothetical protein
MKIENINQSVASNCFANEPKAKSNKGTLDDIPKEHHDNELIKSGYRIGYKSYKEIFLSMFSIHNETTNVWSHFLGFLFFLIFAIVILILYPNMEAMGSRGASTKFEEQKSLNSSLTLYQFVNKEALDIASTIKAADSDMQTNMHLESDPLIASDVKVESERKVESKIKSLASSVEKLAYLLVT